MGETEPRCDSGRTNATTARTTEAKDALHRAVAASRRGQDDAARRQFELALSLDPSLEPAWLGLALLCRDSAVARAIYQRVLEFKPDSLGAREGLKRLDDHMTSKPHGKTEETSTSDEPMPRSDVRDTRARERVVGNSVPAGPSLFVPPWEIETPVPIIPESASSDLSALPALPGIRRAQVPERLGAELDRESLQTPPIEGKPDQHSRDVKDKPCSPRSPAEGQVAPAVQSDARRAGAPPIQHSDGEGVSQRDGIEPRGETESPGEQLRGRRMSPRAGRRIDEPLA